MVSTASSGGSPWVSVQFTGSTHSGWSAHAAPTGRSATTGTPDGPQHLLRADAGQHQQMCGSNCAGGQHDSVGGQIDGPVGSDTLHADRRVRRRYRTRLTRVLVSRVRFGAVHRGLQVRAAGAHPGPAVDVQRHRADACRQRLVIGVAPLRSSIHRYPASATESHERCCAAVEFGNTTNENRSRPTRAAECRSRDRFRSRESAAARRPTSSPAIPSRRSPSGRPRQK